MLLNSKRALFSLTKIKASGSVLFQTLELKDAETRNTLLQNILVKGEIIFPLRSKLLYGISFKEADSLAG